jgi:hypothetical protein
MSTSKETKQNTQNTRCERSLAFHLETRKGTLGRPRYKWEDDIKMNFKELGCERVERIHLAQDEIQ